MTKGFLAMFAAVVMVSSAFSNSMAQGVGFKGIGVRLGLVEPEGPNNTTVFVGGHADFGEIIPNLNLYPSLEFSRKNSFTIVAINTDVRYYLPVVSIVKPFAGGGLAILATSGDSDVGLDLLGGVDFPVALNITAFTKLKFTISDNNIFRLTGGITFNLFE
ncbi:MAG: hypothetical protein ACE5HO_02210 [bacterium]